MSHGTNTIVAVSWIAVTIVVAVGEASSIFLLIPTFFTTALLIKDAL